MNGFPFSLELEVRFRDLDAMGHVNNAVFLTYFESARLAWWLHLNGRDSLRGMDMILARVELDYRAPLGYRDRIEVSVRCASLKRSSFVVEQAITVRDGGRVAAEARKVCVYYDFAAGRSQPIPDALRARILAQDPGARQEG